MRRLCKSSIHSLRTARDDVSVSSWRLAMTFLDALITLAGTCQLPAAGLEREPRDSLRPECEKEGEHSVFRG